ncbi:MAG: hypothetical protein PHU85_14505, partial [Phycisphaerae bacterium]|nr:hypothetical protein [Phycisphaerae bacterium]
FTFELSSHELPRWNVEYHYTAKQPIAVAGPTPAGQTALQAATRISRITLIISIYVTDSYIHLIREIRVVRG